MSPFWILLELRVTEIVVTTGATRRAKLPSNHHHQQTNTHSSQTGCPSCCPTNSVKALKEKALKSNLPLLPKLQLLLGQIFPILITFVGFK